MYMSCTSQPVSGLCCNPGTRQGGSLTLLICGGHLLRWTKPPIPTDPSRRTKASPETIHISASAEVLKAHGLFKHHLNPSGKWRSQVKSCGSQASFGQLSFLARKMKGQEGWMEWEGKKTTRKATGQHTGWSSWCFSSKTCSGPAYKLLFSSEH